MTQLEQRWLDYAWSVLNSPAEHRRECLANGSAVPGPGRVDGNDLRWPGYLGRDYEPASGVLCVGAVHREGNPANRDDGSVAERTDAELVAGAREWLTTGRSPTSDAGYLESLRSSYQQALPTWSRWQRHYRTLVEDYLGLDIGQIAWANLAKCRVAIDRGSAQRSAEGKLTRLCQRQFPAADLIEVLRPAAVLVAVLRARPGGGIVTSWGSESCAPLVFAWQGQSGHDRHNTAPGARRLAEWAPEAAAQIRARMSSAAANGNG